MTASKAQTRTRTGSGTRRVYHPSPPGPLSLPRERGSRTASGQGDPGGSVREFEVRALLGVAALRHTQVLLELDRQAAVHDEGVPSDERRLLRAEEDDRIRDVDGAAGPAERVLLLEEVQPLGILVPALLHAFGDDVAGADGVD